MALQKAKTPLSNVILVCAALALSALAIECSLAFFVPQNILISVPQNMFFLQNDPILGWKNKPGVEGVYKTSSGATRIRINSFGLRGQDISPDKAAGVKRILFLGDSTTFGQGVEEDQRISHRLGKRLSKKYEVLDLSVFGYGTDQEALLLKKDGLRFTPDIVVVGFTAGDVKENMSSGWDGANKPFFLVNKGRLELRNVPVPITPIIHKNPEFVIPLKDFLYGHSHLYRFVFNRLMMKKLSPVYEMSKEEGMRVTLAILEDMKTLCKKNGCYLVALLFPHADWIAASANSRGDIEMGYFPFLKTALRRIGITVIDPTDALLKRYKENRDIFLKNDPVHLSVNGNEIVADSLYQELTRQKFVLP